MNAVFLSLIYSASFNLEKYATPNVLHNKYWRQTSLGEEKYLQKHKWIMQKIQPEFSGENFPSESYWFKYKVYSCRWFTINLICR